MCKNQTNGSYVYIKLNINCSRNVSEQQQLKQHNGAAYVLHCICQDKHNKFDCHLCHNIQMNHPRSPTGIKTSIKRRSKSNYHINSYSSICVSLNKHCFFR